VSSTAAALGRQQIEFGSFIVACVVKVLYAAVSASDYIFLAALTAMLFRPPDLKALPIDRIAFATLLCVTGLSLVLHRKRLRTYSATWPLGALLAIGLWGVISQPYDAQAWSLLAAKWIVPFALFHLGGTVFCSEASLRKLEWFSIATLFYLALISVFYLLGFNSVIFPRFVLDESIGIHIDRARGPFLQAVANGVSLNILALVAVHSFRRRRMHGIVGIALLVLVPLAILATKTRAVWLSALLTVFALLLPVFGRRVRTVALGLAVTLGIAAGTAFLSQMQWSDLSSRLEDRSPVTFRMEMYRAGWEMFTEKPFTGWGSDAKVQPEVAKRIDGFHLDTFVFHNTYLELAVQRGVLGLALYVWLMACLFRIGKRENQDDLRDIERGKFEQVDFLGLQFCPIWILILLVYLLNASVVVMNYQFLNGYLFTVAGILCAQEANRHRSNTARPLQVAA
jgi:O-antigen ligase